MLRKKAVFWALLGIIAIAFLFGIGRMLNPLSSPPDAERGWGQAVAVIYLEGAIVAGHGQQAFFASLGGSDAVIRQLEQAKNDPDVGAVVLRINSPGGSAAASQEIYNQALRLKEAGKPLVASFADVAASGGYWIACAADEIVANPASMTGSIGVIMEVTNFVELYEKLGIGSDVIKSGEHKDMGSASRPLDEGERLIMQSMVDDIYEQFLDVVTAGRNLSRDDVRELADGRIFTGRQAAKLGLVDRLGDLSDAVDRAGELAGIAGRPRIKELGIRSPLQLFLGSTGLNLPWPVSWLPNPDNGQMIYLR
ncbi:MAG: signal peptide peptidase SppA [Bacillota bacterium]|nr:signal peptide peptidase SppA [Bacillota bacterium]MDW7684349.1 signal peptide peptidase SppA [Bacillota bacterium]